MSFRGRQQIQLPSGESSILSLLGLCQLFSCTDPRDKLFGLLGLMGTPVNDDPSLQPDYTTSVVEVCRRFAGYAIASTRSLHILHSVGTKRTLCELPSWVPDWSVSTKFWRFAEICPSVRRTTIGLPIRSVIFQVICRRTWARRIPGGTHQTYWFGAETG